MVSFKGAAFREGSHPDLRTAERDAQAARRLPTKVIRRHSVAEQISIAGSATHEAAIKRDHQEPGIAIDIRPITSLQNLVEQDHGSVKRGTRPKLGFTSLAAAQDTWVGIERMHMLKKRPLGAGAGDEGRTPAEPC